MGRMRSTAILVVLAAGVGLGGCTGEDAGAPGRRPYTSALDPSRGMLALPERSRDPALVVIGAEMAFLPTRYEERYSLPVGTIEYERLETAAFFPETVDAAAFRAMFRGVVVKGRALPSETLLPRRADDLAYAPFAVGKHACVAFRRALGPRVERGRRDLVAGYACAEEGAAPEPFTEHVVAFARDVSVRGEGGTSPPATGTDQSISAAKR